MQPPLAPSQVITGSTRPFFCSHAEIWTQYSENSHTDMLRVYNSDSKVGSKPNFIYRHRKSFIDVAVNFPAFEAVRTFAVEKAERYSEQGTSLAQDEPWSGKRGQTTHCLWNEVQICGTPAHAFRVLPVQPLFERAFRSYCNTHAVGPVPCRTYEPPNFRAYVVRFETFIRGPNVTPGDGESSTEFK
jgi:hypothetical protein